MLTKTELSYLKGLKRFGGMPSDQIEFELTNLIANQNGHKVLKKKINELTNKLNKAEKKIENLKEQLNKKDKKIFDLSIQKDQKKLENPIRSNKVNTANVHQLKRIEIIINDSDKPLKAYSIYKLAGMTKEQCMSGLNYLIHHNIIKCDRGKYESIKK